MRRAADICGFTRCDLLALVTLTAFSAAFAAPCFTRTRLHHQDCARNLGALGRAVQVYAVDNSDHLPGCQHAPPSWIESLAPYCLSAVYACPSGNAHPVSIALNDFLTPHPHGARNLNFTTLSSIPAPSATLLFAEGEARYLEMKYDHFHFADALENGFTPPRLREQVDLERHGSAANYLFPDGHVETVPASRAVARVGAARSFFVHPAGASASEYAAASRPTISWY